MRSFSHASSVNRIIHGSSIVQQPTSIVNAQAGSVAEDASIDTAAPEVQKDGQTAEGSLSISQTSGKTSTSTTVTAALARAGHTLDVDEAELVLQLLRQAYETNDTQLVESALDCLHKLIAYDHLEGDPGLDGGKNSPLFTDILNMVCGCVDNSPSDSTILQVLKVLRTAVASTKFRVHGEPLLAVIRVCYNIALNSKSPINQATSKAMLTQMVSIVFRRMESDQHISDVSKGTEESLPDTDRPDAETSSQVDLDDNSEKGVILGDMLSVNQTKDTPIASVEELQNLAGGADIKGLEAVLDNAVHIEDGKKITRGIDLDSMNIGQRDALLLFRTLRKMGMNEDTDKVTTKTRLLSLELLQGVFTGHDRAVEELYTFQHMAFLNVMEYLASFGTVNMVVPAPSGAVFLCTESRATTRLPNGVVYHTDLSAKIQVIGPFYILPSGKTFFINLVLEIVRRDYRGESNLDRFRDSLVRAILEAQGSQLWANHIALTGDPFDSLNSYIIGSILANEKGKFENGERITISSNKLLSDVRSSGISVSGDRTACRVIENFMRDIDRVEHTSSIFDVHCLVAKAMSLAYGVSAVCGGPVDIFMVKPFLDSFGDVQYQQSHALIVPEIFFAEHDVSFERSGNVELTVTDAFLQSHGLEREQVGSQVSILPYSHSVDRMLHERRHSYKGIPETTFGIDLITRHKLFDDI